MINFKYVFKELILQFQSSTLPEVKARDLIVPDIQREIITIIGPRRSGKTYLMYIKIKELFSKGIPKENIIYINFEDERLLQADITDLNSLLIAYQELKPDISLSDCYFFLDEIQNIDNWEKFVRRIHDSVSKNIYLTGSNSKFLTSDIATSLRGRSINLDIFTLSFEEFLKFKNIDFNNFVNNQGLLLKYYNEYIEFGGYPSVVLNNNTLEKINLLQSYYNTLIQKDLQERYKILNIELLKYFCQEIIQNNTNTISLNKISNNAKSIGFKFEKNYIYTLYDSIQNIYLGRSISKYTESFRKSHLVEKKFYIIDNGIYNTVRYRQSENTGVLLEALVFQYLLRIPNLEIFFYKDSNDYVCDFVLKNSLVSGKVETVIQVTKSIADDQTYQREIRGLISSMKYFKLKKGYIITQDDNSSEIEIDGFKILILNVKEFLLNFIFDKIGKENII